MEAIVQPKQARTPGDTRLPRAQAVHVSFFPDGVPPKICAIYGLVHEANTYLLTRPV